MMMVIKEVVFEMEVPFHSAHAEGMGVLHPVKQIASMFRTKKRDSNQGLAYWGRKVIHSTDARNRNDSIACIVARWEAKGQLE